MKLTRFRPRVEALEARDNPSPTFTTLYSSADPSISGQPITLTAFVSGGDFLAGTDQFVFDYVDFYANGIMVAVVKPVNGIAAYTAVGPTQSASVNAFYTGGSDPLSPGTANGGSWSGVLSQIVLPVPTIQAPVPVPLPAHHHHHHPVSHHHVHHRP